MLGLEFEPELITRLTNLGLNARPAPDLAAAVRSGQGLPAVFVVYRGYRIVQRFAPHEVQIESTWFMVAGVKDVKDQLTGAAARTAAVPMVQTIIDGLMAWRLPSARAPLELAPAPVPQFEAGTLWLPIGFTIRSTVTAPVE